VIILEGIIITRANDISAITKREVVRFVHMRKASGASGPSTYPAV
jgi:hypothetical protein